MRHTHPDKELVRRWLLQRQLNPCPLPDREQIQRQLGWRQQRATPSSDERQTKQR
jgi:hypothetical protein